jgi:molecular chaperone GrpE (heat shock protein)
MHFPSLSASCLHCSPSLSLSLLHLSQNLYKQFVDFLRGLGVEAVATVGTLFDPNLHEAIMKEASSEVPDDTVSASRS